MKSRWRLWLWRLLGLTGLSFMVAVVMGDIRRDGEIVWPHPFAVLAAFGLVSIGLWLASEAWLRVLGDPPDRMTHRADFFSAQLGKYLPGGFWQPVGQVGLSSERGISKIRSSAAVVAHAGIQVSGGSLLAVPLVFRSDLPSPARVAAAAGLLVPFAFFGSARFANRSDRLREAIDAVGGPGRASWTLVLLTTNLLLQGIGFSLLASVSSDALAPSTIAFGVAWTLGFLALPFPAGLGVREAVLVAVAPVAAATVITASVIARVVTASAEIASIAATRFRS